MQKSKYAIVIKLFHLPKAAARGVNMCNHCQLRPPTLSSGIARDTTVLKR